MAITKTKFINLIRCPRYSALSNIQKDKLDADVTFKDYKEEEYEDLLSEMVDTMIDEDGNDIIEETNPQLEVMMPFYNKIELLAGAHVEKVFNTKATYASETLNQESFDFKSNGIKYLCYVDIYFETEQAFNIVEVKATTSKSFLALGKKNKEKEHVSIFKKELNGIYKIDNEADMKREDFFRNKKKLYDKYNSCGRYVYDLAVQRYIIENDLRENGEEDKIPLIKYYLATLNSDYVFDGTYENDEAVYNKDEFGNDIIVLFDLTDVTFELMEKIDLEKKKIENYVEELKADPYPLGVYCEYKKTTKCKYAKVCFAKLPTDNSILKYIGNHHGFKDEFDNKYETYDLLNDGMVSMLDVPVRYLNRPKNQIQREVVLSNIPYVNKQKIEDGIDNLKYPIYHLDFETFPCPLPRFKGEKCYGQSVFQFSLHIERKPGICDKEKDHFEFLSSTHEDRREDLIKAMCEHITNFSGTILVFNESFEKSRIKELGEMFPIYKEKLTKMRNMIFDLMFIVSTNSKFYESLGYEEDEAKMFNYYHPKLNGSFSIKKVLPVFSKLSYADLEVGNGNDAIVTYAKFPTMTKQEFDKQYKNLIEYCKQDTWAMVEILEALRKLVK